MKTKLNPEAAVRRIFPNAVVFELNAGKPYAAHMLYTQDGGRLLATGKTADEAWKSGSKLVLTNFLNPYKPF